MQFKKSFTEPVPAAPQIALEKAGVTTYHGRAKFIAENTIDVNENILYAQKFVIAMQLNPESFLFPKKIR